MPLPAILAGAALKLSPIGKFLKSIPWQVWLVAALVAAVPIGSCIHRDKVADAYAKAFNAGVKDERARVLSKALRLERRARELEVKINTHIRSQVDEENRVTAGRADGLRLRGPGRAACSINSTVPDGAGQHQPASGRADAPAAGVPGADRLAMPFDYAVSQGETCDLNRTEVKAWRSWHDAWVRAWAELAKTK